VDESEIRKQAISKYEDGESPKQIYQSLGKSKRWFFKWLNRYKEGSNDWFEELSGRPHSIKQKIDSDMEQTIIDTRDPLLPDRSPKHKVASERERGWSPSHIHHKQVLKRNDLVKIRKRYKHKGADYPALKADLSNFLHQFDVIGFKYLKTDERFYLANSIYSYDRRCCINPVWGLTKTDIVASLISFVLASLVYLSTSRWRIGFQ